MPFNSVVNNERDIVVLKAKGKVSVMDIINEIQHAISTKRGDGITRRLIDMRDQEFSYDLEDAKKILKMMEASADVLGSKRMAVLFKEIPDSIEFKKIISLLNSATLEIELFTDKAKAVQFLNKPSGQNL